MNKHGKRYDYLGQMNKFGKPHGLGRLNFHIGNWYEGELQNGFKHGYGRFIYKDGEMYEGWWQSSKYHGEGILISKTNVVKKGNFCFGKYMVPTQEDQLMD